MLKTSDANEDIVKILLEQDDLTWKDIIYELVKSNQMDPWDIDVSMLAKKFLDLITTLQKMDFRITGKLVLAASLLLKIKSNYLVEEELTALDNLIQGEAVSLLDELPLVYELEEEQKEDTPKLIPRTPQPRTRRVSLPDLVTALEKALVVEVNRVPEHEPEPYEPKDVVDVSKVIVEVYNKIQGHFNESEEKLSFEQLLPEGAGRHDKVYTFIPLLHLDHQRNIDLMQKKSFDPIYIEFLKELDDNFVVPEGDLGA